MSTVIPMPNSGKNEDGTPSTPTMFDLEAFRSRLADVKDNPTEVAKLTSEVMAYLATCLEEVAPYLPSGSPLIANSKMKKDQARIEQYFEALMQWRKQHLDPDAVLPVWAPLTGSLLAEGFALLGQSGTRAEFVFLNARDCADIRSTSREFIDLENRSDYLKMGVVCYFWGVMVVVRSEVPAGTVYMVPELQDGKFPMVGALSVER